MAEVARVLRPGGAFVLTTFMPKGPLRARGPEIRLDVSPRKEGGKPSKTRQKRRKTADLEHFLGPSALETPCHNWFQVISALRMGRNNNPYRFWTEEELKSPPGTELLPSPRVY